MMKWNDLIGQKVGQYTVVEELGRGGFGRVFLAQDDQHNRRVAVKALSIDPDDRQAFMRRFTREVAIIGTLDHPNIVPLYDAGETDEFVYMAMPLLKGGTLRQRIASQRMPVQEASHFMIQIARALHHAHQKGIIHRNVKPANMLLDIEQPGRILLKGFGMAKIVGSQMLTNTGTLIGAAEYMSPEHAEGRALDQRADIYSLGCVLYELLAGRSPFAGESSVSVLYQQVHTPPTSIRSYNSEVPSELWEVLRLCLAKRPEERHGSAEQLAEALQPFADGVAVQTLTPWKPSAPWTSADSGSLAPLSESKPSIYKPRAPRPTPPLPATDGATEPTHTALTPERQPVAEAPETPREIEGRQPPLTQPRRKTPAVASTQGATTSAEPAHIPQKSKERLAPTIAPHPQAKVDAKAVAKVETKPEAKPAAKVAAKPAAKSEKQSDDLALTDLYPAVRASLGKQPTPARVAPPSRIPPATPTSAVTPPAPAVALPTHSPTYLSAFMCHAHADNALTDQYAEALSTLGVPLYYDRANPQTGRFLGEALEQELERRQTLFVMVTPASIASFWVQLEINTFLGLMSGDSARKLIPVRMMSGQLPPVLNGMWWIDAVDRPFADVLSDMIRALSVTPKAISTPIPSGAQGAANAFTRVVDWTGKGHHTTIRAAISAAQPGERILVRKGVYNGGLAINKRLVLVGDGQLGDVEIHAVGANAIKFTASQGRIANLTLRQDGGGNWYGVDIAAGELVLEGCDISSKSNACVAIHAGANPTLRHNRIHGSWQSGVYVFDEGRGLLEDNDIYANSYAGVAIKTSGAPTLRDNRIYQNNFEAIRIYKQGGGVFERNALRGNSKGPWLIDATSLAHVTRNGNME